MCGIAGVFDTSGSSPINLGTLRRMCAALRHRGPDGEGFHVEPGVGFGHRRLSIIDIKGGGQPMFNEDGSVVIVFNGEIYDHEPLRRTLERLGHRFVTRSDTETIIHAWEEWGTACLEKLLGMFAFVIWDRNRGELFFARDRLGKKPLYYTMIGNHLVFASELSGLAACPGFRSRLSATSVQDYFALGYVLQPDSIYEGVFQLPAGCFMITKRGQGRPTMQRYWRPRFDDTSVGEEAATDTLRYLLRNAVERRLVADVPVGAFLSGGVDSSAIVAVMADLRADPVSTFTIGLGGSADETVPAEATARRLHTIHTSEQYDVDYIDAARDQSVIFGEPFADSSSVPTYRVSQLARQAVTVALSGDGGDEFFAGYRRYRWHLIGENVRTYVHGPLQRKVLRALACLYPHLEHAPRWLRAKQTLTELSLDSALAYYRMVCRVKDEERNQLMSPRFLKSCGGYDPGSRFAKMMEDAGTEEPLTQAIYVDLQTWLPSDILVKVDRASMANSLEVRAPFLDHHLVEWAATLPRRCLMRHGEGKSILKRAVSDLVNEDIIKRAKQGFSKPLARQFRGSGAERLRQRLLGPAMLDSGIFNSDYIGKLTQEHNRGDRDHSPLLWSLLVFEGFLSKGNQIKDQPAHSAPCSAGSSASTTMH